MTTTSQSSLLRLTRVALLSIVYFLLVFLAWRQIAVWIVEYAPTSVPTAQAVEELKWSGFLFVVLNSLTFAGSLLWFARTRDFSPVARYLVPTVLAVLVTYIVMLPVLRIETIVPNPGEFFARTGLLIYWMDTVVPGLAAAQLFRFPRPRTIPSRNDVPITQAV